MRDRPMWLLCKSSFHALYATLLLIGLKWKLVELDYSVLSKLNFLGFLGYSSGLREAVFQIFAGKQMEWQVIVRLMMVFWFLCKTDCKKVNWAEQKLRWKDQKSPTNSRSLKELLINNRLETSSLPGLVLTYSLKRTCRVFHIEFRHILKEQEVKSVKLLSGDYI